MSEGIKRSFVEQLVDVETPGAGVATSIAGPGKVLEVRGSGREGIKGNDYAILRKGMCECIHKQKLPAEGYILIIGPPDSGKTGTLQCLQWYFNDQQIPCMYVKCTDLIMPDKSINFDAELTRLLEGKNLQQLISAQEPLILLIDEAQLLWDEERSNSASFWAAVKSIEQGGAKVCVVLAAAFGLKRSAPVDEDHQVSDSGRDSPLSHLSTPPGIEKKGRTITVHREEDGLSLSFSKVEWEEVCAVFERKNPDLKFAPYVKRYIYECCAGQVGLVMACLDYLETELKNELKLPVALDSNAMYKLTNLGFLKRMDLVRSFIRFEKTYVIPGAAAVLRYLLSADYVHMDELTNDQERKAARKLHVTGMVLIDDSDRIQFTSPLHKVWYLHKAHTDRMPHAGQVDLVVLLRTIFERMDSRLLEGTDAMGVDGSPLESCWEAETYRVCVAATSHGTMVSTQAGQALGGHGPVDVYLGGPYRAAIEFVRNGDRLRGHLDRFRQGGWYWPLVQNRVYKLHAVVDVRRPGYRVPPAVQDEILYTVVMNDDWQCADIWHMGTLVAEKVQLWGDATEYSLKALQLVQQRVQSQMDALQLWFAVRLAPTVKDTRYPGQFLSSSVRLTTQRDACPFSCISGGQWLNHLHCWWCLSVKDPTMMPCLVIRSSSSSHLRRYAAVRKAHHHVWCHTTGEAPRCQNLQHAHQAAFHPPIAPSSAAAAQQ